MKFVEGFCTAVGAIGLIVFGSTLVTGSHYNFSLISLVVVLAVSAGYAAFRASDARSATTGTVHRPARFASFAFIVFLACGIVLIATSSDRKIRYSQTTLVFDHTATDHAALLADFLSLHEYLTRSGFVPTSAPQLPFGFRSGLTSQRMASFSYARQSDVQASFRIRVDIHPEHRHLTCHVEPYGARRGAYEEAVKRSGEFSQNLRQREPRFFQHGA